MQKSNLEFNPHQMPSPVRPFIILKGTPYEMGIQYGEQARDMIIRTAASMRPQILSLWESEELLVAELDSIEGKVKEKTPDILDIWKGIAVGAGISYDEVRMINFSLSLLIMAPKDKIINAKVSMCSNFSVWGKATKDGRMYTAANLDQMWNKALYTPVVVAFPKGGIPFVFTPPNAGEVGTSLGMNLAGVVCAGSGGQDAGEGDSDLGYPNMIAKVAVLMESRSAKEGTQKYLELHAGNAENAHFSDEKEAFLIEYTPAHYVIRNAGDNGEEDYLVATNTFIAEKMKSSLFPSGMDNCMGRYKTYVKKIQELSGTMGYKEVADVLACHDYYDGERWFCDVYDGTCSLDSGSMFTPEMRSVEVKTLMKAIAAPAGKELYFMNGSQDVRMSTLPDANGQYCRMVLDETIIGTLKSAVLEAKQQIWEAGKNLNQKQNTDYEKDKLLNEAKKAIWTGFNYQTLADIAEEQNDKLMKYGQALTCFAQAQVFAKQAIS